jgi:hypothetical protein
LSINLRAERMYASHGFIGLTVQKNESLRKLFNIIFEICTEMHRVNPRYRPHLIERWPRLRREQQALLAQHGTYKTFDVLDLHLSIAQVDDRKSYEALRIGQKNIIVPQEFGIEYLQLVNIGHKNERWDILYQWPK